MSGLRKALKTLSRTPLHPQWLLGQRAAPAWAGKASGVLLDIGAGDRWVERQLPLDIQYIALDYPATGQVLYGAKPDVFADAASLPIQDACIDMVICLEVVEHVREPELLLSEIARVLRSDGSAHLSMPFLYPVHDAPHDYQRWTRHGWQRSVLKAGLELVSIRETGTAIEAAAALACLSLAGPMQRKPAWQIALAAPFLLVLVPMINLLGWTLARCWPAWSAMSTGLQVEVRKL